MVQPVPICFILATQEIRSALAFAAAKAGNNNAARMAMMAMTTKSSINVKARRKPPLSPVLFDLFILFTMRILRIWQILNSKVFHHQSEQHHTPTSQTYVMLASEILH
jgi:hypothetical protein